MQQHCSLSEHTLHAQWDHVAQSAYLEQDAHDPNTYLPVMQVAGHQGDNLKCPPLQAKLQHSAVNAVLGNCKNACSQAWPT